jgi:hypothetical protein
MSYEQDAILRSLAFTMALEYPEFAALPMREGSTVLDRLMADWADHKSHNGQLPFNRYVIAWLDNQYPQPIPTDGFVVTDGKGNEFPYQPITDVRTHVMCDNTIAWEYLREHGKG